MSLTRFSDDPCRIQKYLEETTNIGNYHLNVPGFGDKPYFINDPFVIPLHCSTIWCIYTFQLISPHPWL